MTTTSITAVSPSTKMPSSRCRGPIVNHSRWLSNGPPPCTKCMSTPSENTNDAPTAAMPYTAPLPGVREPKNRMSAADTRGISTTIHACSTNQSPPVVAS